MNLQVNKSLFFLLVAGAILLVVVIIFFAISLFSGNQESPSDTGVIPTLVPIPESQRSEVSSVNVSPQEDPSGETIKNPSQTVNFSLTEDLAPGDVEVEANPSLPLRVEQNADDSLAVSPDPPSYWKPDVLYTITIYDVSGKIITRYQIKVPPFIPQEVVD